MILFYASKDGKNEIVGRLFFVVISLVKFGP